MSESKYITGQKVIIDILDIKPFQLLNEHIKNGLQPYDELGHPLSPRDVVETVHGVQDLKEHIADMEEDLADDLKYELDKATQKAEAVGDIDWQDFQLSKDKQEAEGVLKELLKAIFLRDDIDKVDKSAHQAKAMAAEPLPSDWAPKERPSNEHERECIKVAKQFWDIDPTIHPSFIAVTPEMIAVSKKKNGEFYAKKTIMNWIRPEWPESYTGSPREPENWPISLY